MARVLPFLNHLLARWEICSVHGVRMDRPTVYTVYRLVYWLLSVVGLVTVCCGVGYCLLWGW